MTEEGIQDKEMSFWEHLAELSIRLRRIIIVVFVLTFILMMIPSSLDPSSFAPLISGDWMEYRPMVAGILDQVRNDLLPSNSTRLISFQFGNPITIYI